MSVYTCLDSETEAVFFFSLVAEALGHRVQCVCVGGGRGESTGQRRYPDRRHERVPVCWVLPVREGQQGIRTAWLLSVSDCTLEVPGDPRIESRTSTAAVQADLETWGCPGLSRYCPPHPHSSTLIWLPRLPYVQSTCVFMSVYSLLSPICRPLLSLSRECCPCHPPCSGLSFLPFLKSLSPAVTQASHYLLSFKSSLLSPMFFLWPWGTHVAM